MRSILRILLLGTAFAGALSGCLGRSDPGAAAPLDLVEIPAGEHSHRLSGQFLVGDNLGASPLVTTQMRPGVFIMRRQVSQAEYAACVRDGACQALDKGMRDQLAADRPVAGVSWTDATAYAAWLSKRTGQSYRLPTYDEWAHAAGSAFEDISVIDVQDSSNPALRWLEEYRIESARSAPDMPDPQPFGTFGKASTGLLDIGGNVWDWTDTCFTRHLLGDDGQVSMDLSENCGIRVLAGKHIGYIPDFIRDPKSGACSVGIPPSNLGIRLVRDDARQQAGKRGGLRELLGVSG